MTDFDSFVEWVREHMPWPYEDVGRDSVEARDFAKAVVDVVWPKLTTEWQPDPDILDVE